MPEVRHRAAWFFVESSGPRSRRPVDVALAAAGLVVLVACARAAGEQATPSLPSWLDSLATAVYALATAYVVVVGVAVVVAAPRQARLAVTVVAAAAAALAVSLVGEVVVKDGYPVARVAVTTAVLLVLRPWVTLTFRRLHAAVVVVECLGAWATEAAGPVDVLAALALGTAAASTVLVVLGSPGGHPDVGQVAGSLHDLGVDVSDLRFAERQPWGARILEGTGRSGEPLLVRVFGRDASDAHRAARWWRSMIYRDQATPGATRLQMVEHEALVTMLAAREGVGVTPVVAAAASQGDALIVLGAPPAPLADAPSVDDAHLSEMWAAVSRLHGAGLCHGELTLEHVGIGDGGLVFSAFGDGTVGSPPAKRAQEVATLLTSQAVLVDAERAVDAAVAGLGADGVSAAQPYLQRAALPRSLRSANDLKATLARLRDTITDRTGVAPQPPAEIARVRWRDLLQIALVLLAAYALLTTLVQLDWGTVIDAWAQASWGWIVVGLVVAQGTSAADSVSTMSMVRARLPLVPLMMLQYAIKFVGLAISATLGRIALNTSFLSRFGQGPAVAVTASASDSFAGAIVNLLIFLVALPFANDAPHFELSAGGDAVRLLELLAVAVALSALAVALLPRLRARVVSVARSLGDSLRVATASPSRAVLLFGSNLVSLLITAASMTCMVTAIHPGPSYATLVVVTATAALFASIIPVPGNVGVGEAAITAGLVAVGIPSGAAFAIAVTQRISTSYLPPVFGAWAVRWLRRADYVS